VVVAVGVSMMVAVIVPVPMVVPVFVTMRMVVRMGVVVHERLSQTQRHAVEGLAKR
jgi:hypothetical protein